MNALFALVRLRVHEATDANTILADRVRLNFDTSFTGEDLLRTRLQARNLVPFTRTGTPGASETLVPP